MKNIKNYKSFKNNFLIESSTDDVIKDIKEICYDLTDYNKFEISIDKTFEGDYDYALSIYSTIDSFLLEEVEEVLLRVKNYLGIGRYIGCSAIKVNNYFGIGLKNVSDTDKLRLINIKFSIYNWHSKYESSITQFPDDDTKKDIFEICYDLTDFGIFEIDIYPFMDTKNFIIVINRKKDLFLLEQVEEVIERLKNYLGKRYKKCYAQVESFPVSLKDIPRSSLLKFISIIFSPFYKKSESLYNNTGKGIPYMEKNGYFNKGYLENKNESSRFETLKETVNTIKDICQEFEDNGCNCDVFPKDDIKLNLISLMNRGYISKLDRRSYSIPNFYLEIKININILVQSNDIMYGLLPEWFIETCRRIQDFMASEIFTTKVLLCYIKDRVSSQCTINELPDKLFINNRAHGQYVILNFE